MTSGLRAVLQQALEQGLGHQQAGRLEAAVACYQRVLAFNPDNAGILFNLGVALYDLGRTQEAIREFNAVLALDAGNPAVHVRLGAALWRLGLAAEFDDQTRAELLAEAEACHRQALTVKPDFDPGYSSLALVLKDQGRLEEAAEVYRQFARLRPNLAEPHAHLAELLLALDQPEAAIAAARQALTRNPGLAGPRTDIAHALIALGRIDEAEALYREVLSHAPPAQLARAYSNLGRALFLLGRADEAAMLYDQALAREPELAEARFNRSTLHLQAGRYAQGWPDYEARLRLDEHRSDERLFTTPIWDGRDLAGQTLYVYPEQGLGDFIQCARFLPLAAARGARVVVQAPDSLAPLLADMPGIAQILPEDSRLPAFAARAPIFSLARVFAPSEASLNGGPAYLSVNPDLVALWRERLARNGQPGALRVGVVWSGNATAAANRGRSLPLASYAPLAAVQGVELISLQKTYGLDELRRLPPGMAVRELGPDYDAGTFADTAAVMANLDLVISSCTSVPHLAGALGAPTWIALKAQPDWRWGLGRADSPWYASAKLYRQPTPGDWAGAIAPMVDDLRGLAGAR